MIEEIENSQDYKEIGFTVPLDLTSNEVCIIDILFNKFPEKEITYDLSDDQFTLFLNSVDIQHLQDSVAQINNEYKSESVSKLFHEIIDVIISIKS